MADTAYLNRRMGHPDVFYRNMGFEDGFNERNHKYLSKPKSQPYYDSGYKAGERARLGLERDAANGEFSK